MDPDVLERSAGGEIHEILDYGFPEPKYFAELSYNREYHRVWKDLLPWDKF